MKQLLTQKQTLVTEWLKELAPAGNGLHEQLYRATDYSLQAGGKRLRPVLSLAVCELLGGQPQQVKHFACAVECIHTYSLIHDDLPSMDDDDLRRGKPASHIVFGEGLAILAGDLLLNYAFELIAKAPLPAEKIVRAIQAVGAAAGGEGMIGGQVIDLAGVQNEEQLTQLHHMKTGALIAAAVQAGAIAGDASEQQMQALTDFAYHLGLAFQIRDDILDATGTQALLGKHVGSDAASCKCTFVTLLGNDAAQQKLEHYTLLAKQALSSFGERASFLLWLADYLLERNQ